MKRWILSVVTALTVCMVTVGCGIGHPNNTAQPVTDGFTCRAEIQYHELELHAQLSRQDDGKLLLAFSLPKSLSGVALGWNGSAMTMELGGMSVAVPADRVPQGALIQRLLQVLSTTPSGGSVTDEGYVMTGDVDGEAFTLVCDPQTGLPRSLSLPTEELEAAFFDCSLLQTNA
ncbi:MAG: hypothetical protein IIW40_02490 [Clostridia bacterium]|nr:hypothetical protein [Clostridia bacterium]